MASSQKRNIGGSTKQEIEVGQGEQENSGRRKVQSIVIIQTQRKQDVTASPKNVPSHMANTDKYYGLM